MENTIMQLWEVKHFQSSAVKTLFIGKTANGQDCIGCAWDTNTVYIYAYEGIVDTFLYALESFKSVGRAMAYAKLKDGMEEGVYFFPYTSGMKQHNHNQWYTLRRYDMYHMANLVVHKNLTWITPEDAIQNLISSGDIECEPSKLVDILKKRYATL